MHNKPDFRPKKFRRRKKRGHNYSQGYYTPNNPEKYVGDVTKIIYRSSWERKFMVYLDSSVEVTKWGSENTIVKYISPKDNGIHRYYVDFTIEIIGKKTGKLERKLIEIKPLEQCHPPKPAKRKTKSYKERCLTYLINQSKWQAARRYAENTGMEFIVLTEKELKI